MRTIRLILAAIIYIPILLVMVFLGIIAAILGLIRNMIKGKQGSGDVDE